MNELTAIQGTFAVNENLCTLTFTKQCSDDIMLYDVFMGLGALLANIARQNGDADVETILEIIKRGAKSGKTAAIN